MSLKPRGVTERGVNIFPENWGQQEKITFLGFCDVFSGGIVSPLGFDCQFIDMTQESWILLWTATSIDGSRNKPDRKMVLEEASYL